MTLTAIARHAAERPGAPAAVSNGRAVSYGQLQRWVTGFARALAAHGLPPRARVAIECGEQLLHLVLMLACERLGACTLSLVTADFASPLPFLAEFDLVVTEQMAAKTAARRFQPLEQQWVNAVMAQGAEQDAPPPPLAPDHPVRLVRTSGTTGTPKQILLTHRIIEARINSWRRLYGVSPGDRHFIASPFTVNAMYWQAAVALRAGGSVAFEDRTGLAQALPSLGVSHVVLMPLLLGELFEGIGPDFAKPPRLTVLSIGGQVSPVLRRRLLDRLATRFVEVYSSNEAGNIAVIEGDAPAPVAAVLPGVAVEIVGSDGAILPHGQEGEIRVRTPYMADEIAGGAAATTRLSRGRWFHPGDVGVLHGEGRLEVRGRSDELMNIGGAKILPGRIEDTVRAGTSVSDVALCMIRNDDGIDEVWVAVCLPGEIDDGWLEQLRPFFGKFRHGTGNLVRLAEIPRTVTGKVKREELRRAVAEAVTAGRGRRRAWADARGP